MFFIIENACFEYIKNKPIIENVSFSLDRGEILAIMGSNGIGKTTLIKCIMGILSWKSGGSYLSDKKGKEASMDIAYVPQAHKTAFSYSVMEMVIFGRAKYMSMFSIPSTKDYDIAKKTLKDMGIFDLKDKLCNELSGGQLQMVMVARALASEPQLLILDEPESHLDFKNQIIILDTIKHLAKEKNITCILNTHYPNHTLKIADKVLLMGDRKYKIGKPIEILNKQNVQDYFGVSSIILKAEVEDKLINYFMILDEM